MQKTIEVDLFSDAPTEGAINVEAFEAYPQAQTTALDFTWDRTSGFNGDKLELTIEVTGEDPRFPGVHPFYIVAWTKTSSTTAIGRMWPAIAAEP